MGHCTFEGEAFRIREKESIGRFLARAAREAVHWTSLLREKESTGRLLARAAQEAVHWTLSLQKQAGHLNRTLASRAFLRSRFQRSVASTARAGGHFDYPLAAHVLNPSEQTQDVQGLASQPV